MTCPLDCPLPSPPVAVYDLPPSSPTRFVSIPMSRSPASMGLPRVPAASHFESHAMSRTNNTTAPRRMPVAIPMARGGVPMAYGGVAMERSKASMGTDYNPFYRRPATPASPTPHAVRTPPAQLQLVPSPTCLPSPPPSPVTPSPREKRCAVNRAIPAWPESPRSIRTRRRRGLSAPPPLHIRSSSRALHDASKTLAPRPRTATPLRAIPFYRHDAFAPAMKAGE